MEKGYRGASERVGESHPQSGKGQHRCQARSSLNDEMKKLPKLVQLFKI